MSIEKARNAKIEKMLDKPIRFQGQFTTRRGMLESLARQGAEPIIYKQRKYYEDDAKKKIHEWRKRMESGGRWIPTGNPNHPEIIAFEKKKQEIMDGMFEMQFYAQLFDRTMYELNKSEMDYFRAIKETQTGHSR
jgi:hypothetical protein